MVTIRKGLPPGQLEQAARLYWEAFGGKLATVMGPQDKALRYIALSLRQDHCFAALGPDGNLIGVAGFKSTEGGFVGGTHGDLRLVYGLVGGLWRRAALWLLSHDVDNHRFLVDGIAVTRDWRGRGIGTALLRALCEEGIARGYGSIRLEVIDANWRARALYERHGFMPVRTERLGPLRFLFGFASATTMVRPLGGDLPGDG